MIVSQLEPPDLAAPQQPRFDTRRQRQALQILAALATAVNALVLLNLSRQDDPLQQVGRALPGLLISLGLLLLTLWPRVNMRSLQRVIVSVLLLWLAANVQNVMVTQRPIASGLLIHLILTALFSFTWLSLRSAVMMVCAGFGLLLLATFFSRLPDVPGLLLTGFTLPVIWYLTQHGLAMNSERIRSETLRTLATTDALTGILNRRAGQAALDAAVSRYARTPHLLCVVLLDIDHFKRINDSLGHQTGDRVLVALAALLNAGLPPGGAVIRWGGEEFLLLLPDQTLTQARVRVLDLLSHVRQMRLPGVQAVTLSGGISVLSQAGSASALLDQADRSLYDAKAAGRDRLHSAIVPGTLE